MADAEATQKFFNVENLSISSARISWLQACTLHLSETVRTGPVLIYWKISLAVSYRPYISLTITRLSVWIPNQLVYCVLQHNASSPVSLGSFGHLMCGTQCTSIGNANSMVEVRFHAAQTFNHCKKNVCGSWMCPTVIINASSPTSAFRPPIPGNWDQNIHKLTNTYMTERK